VDNLARVKMSVSTYMSEGCPLKIQGEVLTVGFPKSHSLHKEALETKDNKALVEKNISELFNSSLRVNFILSEEAQLRHPEEAQDNAAIQSVLDAFSGRLLKEG